MLTGVFLVALPMPIKACEPSRHHRETAAAVEAAVLRYERRTSRLEVRAVDCRGRRGLNGRPFDSRVQPFRGHPAFRCLISYAPGAGAGMACYALVGKALYQVGGCFDPMRDLGAGEGRLLSRR